MLATVACTSHLLAQPTAVDELNRRRTSMATGDGGKTETCVSSRVQGDPPFHQILSQCKSAQEACAEDQAGLDWFPALSD